MLWLAFKTLFHEKTRFAITLVGITISAVLILVQVAIYLGSMGNATSVIRHTDADIWVASKNIQTFDFALPFPEERINRVRSLPEVAYAEKLLLSWGYLKLANGGREQVQIIGFNPDTGIGAPWNMKVGTPYDVKGGNYMIADKSSAKRLGTLKPGTNWELDFASKEHSFKLVGLSQGIKSFTTAPMIFVSYNQLRNFFTEVGWKDQTAFIVAKLKPGSDPEQVVRTLSASLKDNEVLTTNQFIARSVKYWTIQTGLGMAFFLTAIMAMIIGSSVVGQTIYASTLEHLREYGTLKAIGARNGEIYQVIFSLAAFSAAMGYGLAVLIVLVISTPMKQSGVPLFLDPWVFLLLFIAVMLSCLASAYFSVSKIRTYDPVTVFKA